jgi:hypothetical protein
MIGEQFGVSLQSCPRLEVDGYAARIPAVLVLLRSSLLKMDGLTLEGIFRLAPDKEECKRVKAKVNSQQGFEGGALTRRPPRRAGRRRRGLGRGLRDDRGGHRGRALGGATPARGEGEDRETEVQGAHRRATTLPRARPRAGVRCAPWNTT